MHTRQRAHAGAARPLRDPHDVELIARLQSALTEALDQNEIVSRPLP
jgi:hypothetical protein